MSEQEFSEDQRDCLQEICNVAMGQAGDSLARLFKVFIELSVPYIKFVKAAEIHNELRTLTGAKKVSAVRQAFFSFKGEQGLCGEAIVVFSEASFHEMAELMAYDKESLNAKVERELLLDVSNVLNGACLTGLAEQIDEQLSYSPPSLIGQNINVEQVLDREQLTWDQALSTKIGYKLENRSFQCDMFLLMPTAAVEHLKQILDTFLEDF